MKQSIYTTCLPLPDDRYVLYNALSDKYVIATKGMYEAYDTRDPEDVRARFPVFYNQLIEAGCWVEETIDERALLRDRINRMDTNPETYLLTINPTLNCNFHCWYCYEDHSERSVIEEKTYRKILKHIALKSEDPGLKSFHLGFFGGEPLLRFNQSVYPILKHFNEKCASRNLHTYIGFTTNGYLIDDAMIEKMKETHVDSFQITLDGCKEQHDKVRFSRPGTGSYDRIIANIKKLVEASFTVLLRINYTQDNILRTAEIVRDLEDIALANRSFLSVDFQRVWQDRREEKDISEELMDTCIDAFSEKGFHVSHESLDYVRASCYADKRNQAVINYNGDVYKCTARDFTAENRLGYLDDDGAIQWDEEKMAKRCGLRFSKPICHRCRIAPLCGGTCSQRILESGAADRCLKGYTDEDKNQVVLNRFYNQFIRNV